MMTTIMIVKMMSVKMMRLISKRMIRMILMLRQDFTILLAFLGNLTDTCETTSPIPSPCLRP